MKIIKNLLPLILTIFITMPTLAEPANSANEVSTEKYAQISVLDWMIKGAAALDNKKYQDAVEYYTRAIHLDRNYATAFNNRGHAYNELGQYNRALADLT